MKRDFLKDLGLTDEQINSIMSENGKDIENTKTKFADYEDLKKQLDTATEKINSLGDLDSLDKINAEISKYKAEAENTKKESLEKIATMELQQKVKDFTSGKKFVNNFTRDSINTALYTELNKAENKGKSIEELLNTLTEGQTNIFVEENRPQPPKMAEPNGNKTELSGVESAFLRLNPTIKL